VDLGQQIVTQGNADWGWHCRKDMKALHARVLPNDSAQEPEATASPLLAEPALKK
jgi:hypothetical protein